MGPPRWSARCQKATYAPQQDLRFMRLFGGPAFEEIPARRLPAILAADGRPIFNDLLFRRRDPVYVAFDVLNVEGADVRGIPFKDRRAILIRTAERHGMEKSELFFGCGKAMFRAVCDHDIEGIIAKKLDDPYQPERTRWWKILNAEYSQKEGRSELFERRYA